MTFHSNFLFYEETVCSCQGRHQPAIKEFIQIPAHTKQMQQSHNTQLILNYVSFLKYSASLLVNPITALVFAVSITSMRTYSTCKSIHEHYSQQLIGSRFGTEGSLISGTASTTFISGTTENRVTTLAMDYFKAKHLWHVTMYFHIFPVRYGKKVVHSDYRQVTMDFCDNTHPFTTSLLFVILPVIIKKHRMSL